MRYVLTDDLWTGLGPLVRRARWYKGGQKPALSDRDFFEALLDLARTGVPWRDLPSEFGRWDAVYNRFRRRVASGGLRALFEAMTADPDSGPSGGHSSTRPSSAPTSTPAASGGSIKDQIGAGRSAKSQALGRSRGGLSTEVVVTAADEDTGVAADVVPGQAGDAPLPVEDNRPDRRSPTGRPGQQPAQQLHPGARVPVSHRAGGVVLGRADALPDGRGATATSDAHLACCRRMPPCVYSH